MGIVAGSIPRTTKQKLSERVSVLDFDAKGDGVTDDTAAINAAIAYCAAHGKTLVFPAKLYVVSNLAPLNIYNTTLEGDPGARIKFTGAGVGIHIDGSGMLGSGLKVIIRDLILDGNGTLDYCIHAVWMVQGELKNVRCTNCKIAAMRMQQGVLNLIDTLVCSVNVEPFTTVPVKGIILDLGPLAGEINGGNTLLNLRIEGVSGAGVEIIGAQATTILGGSSEGNGTGILFSTGTNFLTTVVGIDCEANSVWDFDIYTYMNTFYNCLANSPHSVKLRSTSFDNHFQSGYHTEVVIDEFSRWNVFDGVSLANPIVDNGNTNVFRDMVSFPLSAQIRNKTWAPNTFNGLTSLTGGVDTDIFLKQPYPGDGVSPPIVRRVFFEALQADNFPVWCGTRGVFTRGGDHDYASALEFWTAEDNVAIMRVLITPFGRFLINTAAAGDDGASMLQVTGAVKFTGNLSVAGDCNITGVYRVNGTPIGTAAPGVNVLVNNAPFGLATSINFFSGGGIVLSGLGGGGGSFQVTMTVPSDLQLKRNVEPLTGGLPLIGQLRPVQAEWNGLAGTSEGKRLTSVVAQELQAIIPDAVSPYRARLRPEDSEDVELLGLEPMAIVSHLILAVQQLEKRLKTLETKVNGGHNA